MTEKNLATNIKYNLFYKKKLVQKATVPCDALILVL